ncbi:MAG TPA: alpha/beta-hydrolase family protein, partial [Gemmatimonadales bacterium]|nr:alpha/beta-hydrolase family protein [Gemmatimonadales bacterium]
PIRVYAGLQSASTAEGRAELAVRELDRTGGFHREVLVVAAATGTGWLEPAAVDSIEYLWGGNTAIASIQYSYLPSWISFLVDKERAADAGQALFDAVYEKWSQLPPHRRPQLIAYGLSLGSYAGQAAFASPSDMAPRTDGALWLGSPSFSEPHGYIEANRDADSPQWRPIYQDGETVRFGAAGDAFAGPATGWTSPRVAYLQHANDPVVWWDPELILERPDWLAEAPGPDRSPDMHWIPVVTFLQVTVDQFFGTSVPDLQGHNYGGTMVDAWQSVVPADGWTPSELDDLQQLIDSQPDD